MAFSPKTRTRIYVTGVAVIALLVAYGLVRAEDAALWTNLAAAILGLGSTGVAVAHRPTKTVEAEPGEKSTDG